MAELKFLDDLAKFGNNTMSAMGGFQKQAGKWVAEQTNALIKGMDLVTREEMDARLKELEVKIAALQMTKETKESAKPSKATKTAKPE